MKKLSGIMLTVLLAIGLCLCIANPAYAETTGTLGDNITYAISKDGETLTVSGEGKIKDFTYTEAGEYSSNNLFFADSSIKNLVIKDGITSIGSGAFSGMKALESITCAQSVVTIKEYAFYGDHSLNKVVLSSDLTYLGDCAFSGRYYQTGEPYLGSSDLTLQSFLFTNGRDYTGIEGIDPEEDCKGLTYIGADVFGNSGVQAQYSKEKDQTDGVIMEDGCVYFDKAVIYASRGMESITVQDGTLAIAPMAFKMLNSDDVVCVLKEVSIPDSVTYIGNAAFAHEKALTSVKLPEGLRELPEGIFQNCQGLTSVDLPSGITKIPARAFDGCTSLSEITIPDGVTAIEQYAFESCSSLKSITLPSKLNNINLAAFKGCSSLDSISFPETLTLIGMEAFQETGLTSVTYTKSGGTIGSRAFKDCRNLTTVTLSCGLVLPETGDDQFAGCDSIQNVTFIGTEEQWDNYQAFGLSASEPEFLECTHNYAVDNKNSKPATCTETGYDLYECLICGNCYTIPTEALGHSYEYSIVKPTYAAKGYTIKSCSGCSISEKINYTAKLKVAAPAISTLTAGKKQVTVKWKMKKYTGYQIQIATSKTFKSGSKTYTVKSYKTVKKTVKKLKSKKKYYVRIRAYKKYSGKNYYSSWSTVKSVKVK